MVRYVDQRRQDPIITDLPCADLVRAGVISECGLSVAAAPERLTALVFDVLHCDSVPRPVLHRTLCYN